VGTASNSQATSLVASYGNFISTVDLCNQKMLSDEAIRAVLTNCPGLHILSMKRCSKVTGSCFNFDKPETEEPVELPALSSLTLSGLDNLKDGHLAHVGRYVRGASGRKEGAAASPPPFCGGSGSYRGCRERSERKEVAFLRERVTGRLSRAKRAQRSCLSVGKLSQRVIVGQKLPVCG
jgi:hypothetical protein